MKSPFFTEEHELFRRTVRDFLETEVAPQADAWEAARRIPRAIFRKMGERGFLGINFPESLGGSDADIFYSIAFVEELPRSRMGGFCAAVTVQEYIATGALHRRGSDELKRRYIAPSIEGKKVGAIAISEPDTGSDVAAIRTSARRDGDSWVLDGAKTWITNGVEGDFYVVAVKTDRDAGAGGISLIVVDADTPGVKTSKLNKMGWHSSDTAEIVFESVRVPLSHLVGEENRGFPYIIETFALERLVAAALAIGAADLALEETLRYIKSRSAFGRTLDKFQALRHRLADLFAEVEAARALVHHTAWLTQQGETAIAEAAMAKLVATELGKRVADECLQMYGGFGFVEEYPMARFFRDARVGTIVAGTSEIMREIIAKSRIDGIGFEAADRSLRDLDASRRIVGGQHDLGEPAPRFPPTPSGLGDSAVAGPPSLSDLFHSLPSRLRPEKTDGWSARFHFQIEKGSSPEWTVLVDGPRCCVTEGLHGTPDCLVRTSEETYVGIELGKEPAEAAFLMGKVKVSNMSEMLRFAKAFRRIGA